MSQLNMFKHIYFPNMYLLNIYKCNTNKKYNCNIQRKVLIRMKLDMFDITVILLIWNNPPFIFETFHYHF